MMKKWVTEDWEFKLIATDGKAGHCRLGLEKGDKFIFQYECPAGFCPKTMPVLHTLCEIIRCGGNYKLRGSNLDNEIDFSCADGCINFQLKAYPINRDENGKPKPNNPRPED